MDTQLFGWIFLAAFVSAAHDSDEDGIMQLLESLKEVHGKVNPLAPLEPLLTPFAETAASTATQKSVRNVGRATDDDAASKTRRGSVLNEFLANLETELDVRTPPGGTVADLTVGVRDAGHVQVADEEGSLKTNKVVAAVVYAAMCGIILVAHAVSLIMYHKKWTLKQKGFHAATFICTGFALAAVLNVKLDVPGGWPEPGQDSPANAWSKGKFWRTTVDVGVVTTIILGWLLAFWSIVEMLLEQRRGAPSSAKLLEEEEDLADPAVANRPDVPEEFQLGIQPDTDLRTIQEQLFDQASRTPDRIAVQHHTGTQVPVGTKFSYRELVQRSQMLAAALVEAGVQPDDLVGLFCQKSMSMVTGMVGILASGAGFCCCGTDLPKDRLTLYADAMDAKAVVTTPDLADKAGELFGRLVRVVVVDITSAIDEAHTQIRKPIQGTNAYASFTSGSTGVPKGVLLSQRAVLTHFVPWPAIFGITENSISLHSTTQTFDACMSEIWPFLSVGAQLVLPAPDALKQHDRLVSLMETQGITHIQFVPSVLTLILHKHSLPSCIKNICLGGEGFPIPLRDAIFKRSDRPDLAVFNIYAPTEVGVWVMHKKVTRNEVLSRDFAVVPVGKPLPHREVIVVTQNGERAKLGEKGEILMGGVGVMKGYLKDDEKTTRACPDGLRPKLNLPDWRYGLEKHETRLYRTGDFGRWLPNGDLEYLGRMDCQVKINGLRIELGEIENALKSVASTEDSAVVAANNTLVAFYSGAATPVELQAACRTRLPEYMVPKAFIPIENADSWPRTSSSKVDRKALGLRAQEHLESGGGAGGAGSDLALQDLSDPDTANKLREAGTDSLGLVRLSIQVEQEEEDLCLNMKAVASFTLHFMHIMNIVNNHPSTSSLQLNKPMIQDRKGLDAYFPFGDVADSMFLAGIAMTDRHVAPTASVRDLGLFIIWMEYLWVLPFVLRPIFEPYPAFGAGAGWFLLTLLYSRFSVITLNKLKLWPSVQLAFILTFWMLSYSLGHVMSGSAGPGFSWKAAGLFCVADPVDLSKPDSKQCDPSEWMRVLGKIFINGGLQSEGMGMEFGYWIVYHKYTWLMTQYMFFFHYGSHIMRCIRAAHHWFPTVPAARLPLLQRVLTMLLSVCARLGALVLFDFAWTWTEKDASKEQYFMREVFSWPGVLVFFQPIGALVWMFCLYKCGLTFKLAGETILGYFLVGYFIPPNLFVHSIVGRNWLGRAQGCDVPSDDWVYLDDWLEPCRDNAYGYPIQMFLTIGFVLGWIQIQSPFVQTLMISQFKGLATAYKAIRKDATPPAPAQKSADQV